MRRQGQDLRRVVIDTVREKDAGIPEEVSAMQAY